MSLNHEFTLICTNYYQKGIIRVHLCPFVVTIENRDFIRHES